MGFLTQGGARRDVHGDPARSLVGGGSQAAHLGLVTDGPAFQSCSDPGAGQVLPGSGDGGPRWRWVSRSSDASAVGRHVFCCKTPARVASGASGGAMQGTAAQPGLGLRRVTFLT